MGVRLLHRTTRTVALSTAGQALCERIAARIGEFTQAVDSLPELEEEPSGTLRLTTTADFGTAVLAELIAGFSLRYPRVVVEMHLSTRMVDLVADGFDVAFRIATTLKDSGLVYVSVAELSSVGGCSRPFASQPFQAWASSSWEGHWSGP